MRDGTNLAFVENLTPRHVATALFQKPNPFGSRIYHSGDRDTRPFGQLAEMANNSPIGIQVRMRAGVTTALQMWTQKDGSPILEDLARFAPKINAREAIAPLVGIVDKGEVGNPDAEVSTESEIICSLSQFNPDSDVEYAYLRWFRQPRFLYIKPYLALGLSVQAPHRYPEYVAETLSPPETYHGAERQSFYLARLVEEIGMEMFAAQLHRFTSKDLNLVVELLKGGSISKDQIGFDPNTLSVIDPLEQRSHPTQPQTLTDLKKIQKAFSL